MLQMLLSGRGRLITHLLVWLLIATLMFYLISSVRPMGEAAGRTFLNLSFPVVIFYLNGRVLVNRFFEKQRYWAWAFYSIVLWLGAAALRTKAEIDIFGGTIFNAGQAPDDGGWKIFLVICLIFFILLVFSGLYQLLENRRELETLHVEAQLNYLKAQINPHFLFNTLNNIYSAATIQHPKTAEMVLRLSDLLRYVTYDAQAEKIPLRKELDHIKSYIELFQLKSESPLPIQFKVDGDVSKCVIEPLLLLPLVENAFKHSDLEVNPKGLLNIQLKIEPGFLQFVIENTFDPNDRQKDDVGGVGLMNITRRLEHHYTNRHHFLTKAERNLFRAELTLHQQR